MVPSSYRLPVCEIPAHAPIDRLDQADCLNAGLSSLIRIPLKRRQRDVRKDAQVRRINQIGLVPRRQIRRGNPVHLAAAKFSNNAPNSLDEPLMGLGGAFQLPERTKSPVISSANSEGLTCLDINFSDLKS